MSTNHSILVIDDEQNIRRSLSMILQRAGYTITTAATAGEALQLLQAGAFDLTFLDIKLPDHNGLQILPEIRHLYPEMPVLVLTAHATLETAIGAVRLGARDYLLKPINPETILERVATILNEQKPRRRREITNQLQDLLAELQTIDGREIRSAGDDSAMPKVDPSRYLKCGNLVLDRHTHSVQYMESKISMPPSTFDYLVTLVRHSPQAVSYEKLVLESQGYQDISRAEAREISRWQMHEIRKLIEPDPRHPQLVITVRDIGYRLVR